MILPTWTCAYHACCSLLNTSILSLPLLCWIYFKKHRNVFKVTAILAVHKQLCKHYSPSVFKSVHPPNHFHFVSVIVSSWNVTNWLLVAKAAGALSRLFCLIVSQYQEAGVHIKILISPSAILKSPPLLSMQGRHDCTLNCTEMQLI